MAAQRTEWFHAGTIDVALPDASGMAAAVQNIKLPWQPLGKSIFIRRRFLTPNKWSNGPVHARILCTYLPIVWCESV